MNFVAQDEKLVEAVQLTDAEIMRRVRDIKSTWSVAERAARRREADRRFENLMETLFAEAA
ncbi:hypothetical protein FYK55_19575 [Roseiconus nitratireducens]|uniref:Uncharacterized protein n=1 Tax=Roseiconus nitratireducens TaxID=2605748 RepID=A0A5M6D0Y2_9BACT|nr:hypothetical protein FYK55_19575 [Roseiconus nitratireducens]